MDPNPHPHPNRDPNLNPDATPTSHPTPTPNQACWPHAGSPRTDGEAGAGRKAAGRRGAVIPRVAMPGVRVSRVDEATL